MQGKKLQYKERKITLQRKKDYTITKKERLHYKERKITLQRKEEQEHKQYLFILMLQSKLTKISNTSPKR